jgi:hypothetical protein
VERYLAEAADHSPREPFDEHLVRDIDVNDRVDRASELTHHGVERVHLFHRARESVEQNTPGRIRLPDTLAEHRNGDLVRYQRSAAHEFAGLHTKFRFLLKMMTEEIARRDVREAQLALQVLGLRAFTGPRGAKKDEIHIVGESYPVVGR